jgi:hypothetical protein
MKLTIRYVKFLYLSIRKPNLRRKIKLIHGKGEKVIHPIMLKLDSRSDTTSFLSSTN